MFYRIDENGNASLFENDGNATTRIENLPAYKMVYPVGSDLSVAYEHPEGVVLTIEDAKKIGLKEEFEK
jgi:hypothetical protein